MVLEDEKCCVEKINRREGGRECRGQGVGAILSRVFEGSLTEAILFAVKNRDVAEGKSIRASRQGPRGQEQAWHVCVAAGPSVPA